MLYQYLSSIEGYKVYGSSRTPENTALLKLDITCQRSIDRCLESLIALEGRVDVLINNVGANVIGSLEGTSMVTYEHLMAMNFYGTLGMMKAVMPYFRENQQGRIINISSIGAKVPLPYNSAYAASKSALEAMSESFLAEIEPPKISISLIEPLGLTIEDEVPNLHYIDKEVDHCHDSQKMFDQMMKEVNPSVTKLEVAKVVEKVINSKHPRFRYTVGKGSKLIIFAKALLPIKLFQSLMKKALL